MRDPIEPGFERSTIERVGVDLLDHPQIGLAQHIFAEMVVAGDTVDIAIERVAVAGHHLAVGLVVIRFEKGNQLGVSHRHHLRYNDARMCCLLYGVDGLYTLTTMGTVWLRVESVVHCHLSVAICDGQMTTDK